MRKLHARPHAELLRSRIAEPRRFIQAVIGPRQVGKTTLVRQILEDLGERGVYVSADEPGLQAIAWISEAWTRARDLAGQHGSAVLALDEVHKLTGWADQVKALWDQDTHTRTDVRLVVLGSAPTLLTKTMGDSLAGRFETIRIPHWSLPEMRQAFGWDLETFIRFGGYPGPAGLIGDIPRWRAYVRDSLIEPAISRDVLLLTRVDKPALLRRVFGLACAYSGQILSYTKMLGQLQDAGNTTTLAHYLDLLSGAGLIAGIPKFAGDVARQRASSPKLMAYAPALVTAESSSDLLDDPAHRGRLAESAVGAHLLSAEREGICRVYYWRQGDREVDFVVRTERSLTAIEVKSTRAPIDRRGLDAFATTFGPDRVLVVGADDLPLERFLSEPGLIGG